jgi:hypothetical protein
MRPARVHVIQRPTEIVIGGEIVYWALFAVLLTPLVTALVHDAAARRWVWLFLDILLPPIGIVRGVCVWLRLM